MKVLFSICLLFTLSLGFSQSPTIDLIKKEELATLVSHQDDTTRIINFWATWCRPCVAELPSFDSLYVSNTDPKVQLILISLDDPEIKDDKVAGLLSRKNIHIPSLLLDETDGNAWINLVEPEWGGAIPATIVLNNDKDIRHFHEGKMDLAGLKELIAH